MPKHPHMLIMHNVDAQHVYDKEETVLKTRTESKPGKNIEMYEFMQ